MGFKVSVMSLVISWLGQECLHICAHVQVFVLFGYEYWQAFFVYGVAHLVELDVYNS